MRRIASWAGVFLAVLVTWASTAAAGNVQISRDIKTDWNVLTATQGSTEIKMIPQAGANVFSIRYRGFELLKRPDSLAELAGFKFGVPIIYPMPNRVRDGVFHLMGREYKFTPNKDNNFLHGLVHSVPWEYKFSSDPTSATIEAWYTFAPGTEALKLFPHPHTIRLTVTVLDDAVKFTYLVDNKDGKTSVPYGIALHPWFLYQGARSDTYLTVPATNLMESVKLLPTGRLLSLDGSLYDLRKPKSLQGFVVDDVYFGMTPNKSAMIDFRDKKLKITLKAGPQFTHMVVFTPDEARWFCVENQTCSTDAHNLYEQARLAEAKKQEASGVTVKHVEVPGTEHVHLNLVPPGETQGDSVEFRFSSY